MRSDPKPASFFTIINAGLWQSSDFKQSQTSNLGEHLNLTAVLHKLSWAAQTSQREFLRTDSWIDSSVKGWWIPKIMANSKREQIHPLQLEFGGFTKMQDESVVSLQNTHEPWPASPLQPGKKSRIRSWALSPQCCLVDYLSITACQPQSTNSTSPNRSFSWIPQMLQNNPAAPTHLTAGLFLNSLSPPRTEL